MREITNVWVVGPSGSRVRICWIIAFTDLWLFHFPSLLRWCYICVALFPQSHRSLPVHYSEELPMVANFLNIPPCSITSIFTPFLLVSFISLRKRDSLSQGQSPNLCCFSPPAWPSLLPHQNSLCLTFLQTFHLYCGIPVWSPGAFSIRPLLATLRHSCSRFP